MIYILDLIIIFILDLFKKLSCLNIYILYDFILFNRIILLFIFFTYLGICFDSRFKLNRKLLILIFIILVLLLCNIYEYKDLNIFFKELYWYTLVINSCFIVHILYLHWIYLFLWKRRKENFCELLSIIAFIFSMSFLVFLLLYIYIKVKILFKVYKNESWFRSLLKNLILVIAVILRFFIFIFANYSSIIIGSSKITNLTIKNIFIILLFFIFTIIVSNWILGITRIIFVWICIFFTYSFQIVYNYFKQALLKNKKSKIKELFYYFFCVNFELVIKRDIEIHSWRCLITEDKLYIKNYKELYLRSYIWYLCLYMLEDVVKGNISEMIFKDYKINWYSRAFLCLIDIDYSNEDSIIDRIKLLKERFNLSDYEIIKLKSDYREYFLKKSITTR